MYASSSTPSDSIMSIDGANRRVGIGTDNPDKTFTARGDMSVTGDLTELISTTVDIDSTNTSIQSTTQFEIDTPETRFRQKTHVLLPIETGALTFDNSTLSIDGFNNRVGVGTVIPEQHFHVSGNTKLDGDTVDIDTTGDVVVDSGNVIMTTVDAYELHGGYVGINIADPLSRLHVKHNISTNLTHVTQDVDNSGVLISCDYQDNTYTPGVIWSTTDSNNTKPKAGVFLKQTSSGSYMHLGTSNDYSTGMTNTAITIDPAGRVGVGITSPSHELQVANGIKSTSFSPQTSRLKTYR